MNSPKEMTSPAERSMIWPILNCSETPGMVAMVGVGFSTLAHPFRDKKMIKVKNIMIGNRNNMFHLSFQNIDISQRSR
jgi:hypothetical protein